MSMGQIWVRWIYQKFYIGTVFGLPAASKTTPLKPYPKNRTPKNAQKWAFLKTAPLNPKSTPKNHTPEITLYHSIVFIWFQYDGGNIQQ